jgi:hypothetical protein
MKWLIATICFLAACTNLQKKELKMKNTGPSEVLKSALSLIEEGCCDIKSVKFDNTEFHLIGRKQNGLGLDTIEHSLNKMWPLFEKNFQKKPKEIAIVDFEAPLGGGPLAPFILGIFFSENVSKEHQELIQSSSGWYPQKSTTGYINNHYRHFANPKEAYVDDMLVHELGHVPFGWGLTQVDKKDTETWWFSFGMGLLYDRLAWKEIYNHPSPLFDGVIATWTEDFSKRKDVDQRLVNPDTTRDKEFRLQRRQTYGHGKAYKYLLAVRELLGPEKFDQVMNNFVTSGGEASYDRFTTILSIQDQKKLAALEKEFTIR